MKEIVTAVLCLFLVSVPGYGQGNAGVEVVLSQKGLNYAAEVAIDILSRELQDKTIENQGDITDIKIIQFNKPTANIQLDQGVGLTLSLLNAFLNVGAKWKWERKVWFVKIRDSGTVTAKAGVSITVSVKIGSENGKPTINAYSCSASLSDFNLKVGGTWTSFIYNMIAGLFKGKIKTLLQNLMCEKVLMIINTKGTNELSTLPFKAKVNQYLTIDYSLTEPPYFTSAFLKSYFKGTFDGDATIYQPPLMQTPTDKMIGFSISEDLFNSGGNILYNNGAIKYTYRFDDSNKLSQAFPFLTNSVGGPFEVNIYASRAPNTSITSSGIAIDLSGEVDILQGSSKILNIKFEIKATATAYLYSNIIKGSVASFNPLVQQITPELQNVSIADVNLSLKGLVSLVVPQINERLSEGFILPSVESVAFEDSSLAFNSRHLTASANVRYKS